MPAQTDVAQNDVAQTDLELWRAHDLVMLDLDGVVYVGTDAVPGAAAHLEQTRVHGVRLAFVTNNASRPPATVAEHLTALGVPAETADVVTSAQAAARVLHETLGAGARVAMLGAAGLETALREVGLVVVGVDEQAAALVTGYGPDVLWRDVMRAAVRVRAGLWWVASNTDLTIPTAFGAAPGHGVLVDMLQRFTGVEPVVAGKPSRPLLEETIRRVGGERPLMVGDRLDTDILGGRNVGVPTLLVMTGVTGAAELVAAEEALRPTYVAADLGGLLTAHRWPRPDGTGFEAGGWRGEVRAGQLLVTGQGGADDYWRVVAATGWAHRDATDQVAGTDDLVVPGAGGPAGPR